MKYCQYAAKHRSFKDKDGTNTEKKKSWERLGKELFWIFYSRSQFLGRCCRQKKNINLMCVGEGDIKNREKNKTENQGVFFCGGAV